MRPGVEFTDIVTGIGDEATRDKRVVINVRFSLPNGTTLADFYGDGKRITIELFRRDCIAGVRYGIEGMRVGGKRKLTIAPHLAYGKKGIPGRIPPDSTLLCEVELLEVRERGVMKPEDYPPGLKLQVGNRGDLKTNISRWQFGLDEDGRCGAWVTVPIPGMKWRHSRMKYAESRMEAKDASTVFRQLMDLPVRFPEQCFPSDGVYVDHSENDGGTHRLRCNDELCLSVTIWESGQIRETYYVTEESPAWQSTNLTEFIRKLIKPVLEASVRPRTGKV